MAYASWSVVFGEQPSAAKWNILGTNDASFNDGTGIFGLYKSLLAVDSNPYKFDVYRNAALNTTSATNTKLPYDAETFDTNSNFDAVTNNRYVAPVAGFYQFDANIMLSATTVRLNMMLYKNGAEHRRGVDIATTSLGANVGGLIQLAATDYVEGWYFCDGVKAVTAAITRFSGFLVCRT